MAVAGWVLEINPFDQPNVQEAKDNTNRVLKEGSSGLQAGSLGELTEGLEPPAYFAIMGYLPYSSETEAAVAGLREKLIARAPRRHDLGLRPALPALDGAVPQGRPEDRAVPADRRRARSRTSRSPGEQFTFGTLIRAQADGDLETLRNHGLPAVRIDVKDLKEQL